MMPRSAAYKEYWCSGPEVRARAFSAWTYSHWLMGTTSTYRWRMPAHEGLWVMILNGDLGLRCARKGYIPASPMPEVMRQRVAGLGDGAKMMDVGRKVVGATWKGLRAAIEWFADASGQPVEPIRRCHPSRSFVNIGPRSLPGAGVLITHCRQPAELCVMPDPVSADGWFLPHPGRLHGRRRCGSGRPYGRRAAAEFYQEIQYLLRVGDQVVWADLLA
jgi:hypothetical protein